MTTVQEPAAPGDAVGTETPDGVAPAGTAEVRGSARPVAWWRRTLRWVLVGTSTLVIFASFLLVKGADPFAVLESMWETAVGSSDSLGESALRATPILLAALATAVPARAGLFNLGGEGQLLLGAIGAILVANQINGPGTAMELTLMAMGAAALGAAWATLPALLKVITRTNEAIASLLLNYIAGLIVTWLCFEPWKDPTSLGQAYSRELVGPERFPVIWGTRVHPGIFVALAAAVLLWVVLRMTTWGFKLRVLGGNVHAARRAGLAVSGLSVAAMAVGGAAAGVGGMIEVAGTEGRLRPDLLLGFGFIGFLASWLARHDPLRIVASSLLLGAIAVGGSGLKITAGLSGGAVNILMALVLFAVLGWGAKPNAERST